MVAACLVRSDERRWRREEGLGEEGKRGRGDGGERREDGGSRTEKGAGEKGREEGGGRKEQGKRGERREEGEGISGEGGEGKSPGWDACVRAGHAPVTGGNRALSRQSTHGPLRAAAESRHC